MSKGCVAIVAVLAALGLGLGPRPGAAQSQKTFSGATEVVVVEVPVQVVKEGEPVRGLSAADFELYDGRKKVPITGFEVLDLASAPANAQAAPIPVSARRHFLILFDLSFSDPKSVLKARLAAKDILKSLHPADLVAVATYSTIQGPQLVLGFTPDRQQAAAALDTLGLPKLFNRSADPLRLVLTDMTSGMGHTVGSGATTRATELKENTEDALLNDLKEVVAVSARADRNLNQQIVRTMTAAFTNLARLMAEVEGRKYVVLLSEGFDSTLITGTGSSTAGGNDLQNQIDRASGTDPVLEPTGGTGSDETFGDTRSQNAVEKMLEEFRRADCAIQAVNIAGLRADNDQGLQHPNGKESLLNMAKSTGGEFYENYNNLSVAMGQMLRRTGVTYVLSFQPDDLKPGDYHKLRVELKSGARGARVVHRPGYYAPKPYQQESPLQKVLETASDVLSEEHGTIATSVLAAPFAGANGLANVPVVVEVEGSSLLAGKQQPQLPVEIYIYALDENGGVQDYVTQTVGLDLAKAEAVLRQGGVKFFANLALRPGKYAIRTLVRNGTTGGSSLRVTELEVPLQGTPTLLPAIFQDAAPARWVNLRQAQKEGQPQPPYLFLLPKDQPYVPTSRPALTPGQDLRLVVQGYNLGAGDWKAEAKVLSADGKEVSGGALQLMEKEAGTGARPTRMVAAFRPPNLPPGDYQLRVILTDGAGQTRTSTARFAVGASAGARGSG